MKENIPDRKAGVILTSDSLGYVLAEKTQATIYSPRYTNSALDGFAVSREDVEKPSCYLLPEKAAQVFRLEKKIVPHFLITESEILRLFLKSWIRLCLRNIKLSFRKRSTAFAMASVV